MKHNKHIIDDQLADFTDNILNGSTEDNETQFAQDPELRDLQKTALRLRRAFPEDGLSDTAIRRMRQNIIRQWNEQETSSRESFLARFLHFHKSREEKWQSQRNRQRWSLVMYTVAGAFLLIASLPLLQKTSAAQPAAGGQNLGLGLFFLFGGLILLAVLFFRRKS